MSALSCRMWELLSQRASSVVAAQPDCACVCAQWLQLCPTPCDRMDCSCLLLCPWDSRGKNTGVGSHALLQEIFPTPRSNPCTAGGFFIPTEQPGNHDDITIEPIWSASWTLGLHSVPSHGRNSVTVLYLFPGTPEREFLQSCSFETFWSRKSVIIFLYLNLRLRDLKNKYLFI